MKSLFKYAPLLVAAAALFSCEGSVDPNDTDTDNPGNGGANTEKKSLVLKSDKTVIQTGDDYATLTVTYGDETITENVRFVDGNSAPLDIENFRFSTDVVGKHTIKAIYGATRSESISITAFSVPIPESPEDDYPERTDFKMRMLLTEVTATGCTYCPAMKTRLHGALDNAALEDKYVFTSCHNSYMNSKDPCYISTEYASYSPPRVMFDMWYMMNNYPAWGVPEVLEYITTYLEEERPDDPAAGISVNASLEDNQAVIKVTIKAAKTGDYRIGAFLLEDGIEATQHGAEVQDWMHTHNGIIRYIDARNDFFGHHVGKIEAGETADYMFVWLLDEIWAAGNKASKNANAGSWTEFVEENLHLAIFVSTLATDEKGREYLYVNNIIDCPIDGTTKFQYQ